MQALIQQWDDQLAVRIPLPVAKAMRLTEGTAVEVLCVNSALVIRRLGGDALEDLLSQITPDNLHGEVDSGPAQGQEIW